MTPVTPLKWFGIAIKNPDPNQKALTTEDTEENLRKPKATWFNLLKGFSLCSSVTSVVNAFDSELL
jgi:hypothetical protein